MNQHFRIFLWKKLWNFKYLNYFKYFILSIITSCIFYSRQITMNSTNILAMLILMSGFIFTTIFYSRLMFPPKYNHHYCRLLLNQVARQAIIKHPDHRKKTIIKSNLFIQTMSNNRFGFHCGQIFFITKFQVVELFMMNLPLITLFYKKICMAK